jgi:hypothetical protein
VQCQGVVVSRCFIAAQQHEVYLVLAQVLAQAWVLVQALVQALAQVQALALVQVLVLVQVPAPQLLVEVALVLQQVLDTRMTMAVSSGDRPQFPAEQPTKSS